jgi:hypothetical protein
MRPRVRMRGRGVPAAPAEGARGVAGAGAGRTAGARWRDSRAFARPVVQLSACVLHANDGADRINRCQRCSDCSHHEWFRRRHVQQRAGLRAERRVRAWALSL